MIQDTKVIDRWANNLPKALNTALKNINDPTQVCHGEVILKISWEDPGSRGNRALFAVPEVRHLEVAKETLSASACLKAECNRAIDAQWANLDFAVREKWFE